MKNPSDIFLTPNQAARILNVSLSTLKKFIYLGRIVTLRTPGGHHRIRRSDLFHMVNGDSTSTPVAILKDKVLLGTSKIFVNLLKRRLRYCHEHARSVARISLKIGKRLDFSSRQMNRLRLASLLHDVGMLNIDEDILNKKDGLSDKEYSIIKTHPLLGEDFVNSIKQFNGLSTIIRQHHERYDGQGYPDGLKKAEICPEARIIALSEAFDVMIAKDSYRKPLSEKEARDEIKSNAVGQFDPRMVEIFLKIYENRR